MVGKYKKHRIAVVRAGKGGSIYYSIMKDKAVLVDGIASKESNVPLMIKNCKGMVDAALCHPLDENYCGFGIEEGRGM